MRHPVSSFFASCGLLLDGAKGELLCRTMLRGVVGDALLAAMPNHATPGSGEDANRVGVLAATCAGSLVDRLGPRRSVSRCVCDGRERSAQAHVAGPPERDSAMFARFAGHGRDAALGGQMIGRDEATAIVAELGEELRGADAPGAEDRRNDLAVWVGLDRVLDGGGQRRDLRDEWPQHGDERSNALTFGVGFEV